MHRDGSTWGGHRRQPKCTPLDPPLPSRTTWHRPFTTPKCVGWPTQSLTLEDPLSPLALATRSLSTPPTVQPCCVRSQIIDSARRYYSPEMHIASSRQGVVHPAPSVTQSSRASHYRLPSPPAFLRTAPGMCSAHHLSWRHSASCLSSARRGALTARRPPRRCRRPSRASAWP